MAAFSAGGWYLGGALEIRLRTFRVGVGNLHDPALGNIMSLDTKTAAIAYALGTAERAARREKLFAIRWKAEELAAAVDPAYDVSAVRHADGR